MTLQDNNKAVSQPNQITIADPRYAEAVTLFSRGMNAEAKALAALVFQDHPVHVDALNLMAAAAMNGGQLDEAEALWRQALDLDPRYFAAYSNLGLLLQNRHKPDEAEATYLRALAIKPDFDDALYNLGLLRHEQGRHAEAMARYREVLAINPRYAKAAQNLGNLLQDQKQWAEAESCFRQAEAALRDAPSGAEIHYKNYNNLGFSLQSQRRLPEAAQAYRQALALNPGYTLAANNLGLVLHDMGQFEASEAAYRQVLQFDPQSPDAWNNLANLLRQQGRFREAEAAYRKALTFRPDYAEGLSNFGLLLVDLKRYDEAETCYRRSLEINPQGADAKLNYGLMLLLQGRYETGWPYYEARYDPLRRNTLNVPVLPFPQWQGEDLQGKSILIWPEQGLGDELQMLRYLPLLRARGARRITLLCKPPLKRLFDGCADADEVLVHRTGTAFDHYDFWDFPLSLPLHCHTGLKEIPCDLPYLHVGNALLAQWQTQLPPQGFKVGLVWKGNPGHKNDAYRSLPGLAALAPLWDIPGIRFISLQKGQGEDEAAKPPAAQPLLDLGPQLGDFADTAAIVAQLDLLICVDTSIAHLAGGMGKPVWVMVPAVSTDWRWGTEGAEAPWYPKVMRLFRLRNEESPWSEVVTEVAAALRALVTGKKEKKPKLPKPVQDKESAAQANARAVTLQQADRFAEAEAAYHKARRLDPDNGLYAFNLGTLYQSHGRLLAAEIAHRDALRLAPEIPETPYNLGLALLAQGRYGEAWPAYEGRYDPRRKVPITVLPQLPFPLWQGESLQGRSILVWLEQGMGDELQFVRYLPQLKAMGAERVTLLCKPPLLALFQASGLADEVMPASGDIKLNAHDYWAPLLNLPRWCGTRHVDDIPGKLPYLKAPAERLAPWAARLPQGGLRVGLVWKGHASHGNDAFRSLPGLAALAPLWQVPGVVFVSLQKGQGEDEASVPPPGQPLIHLGGAIADFADSAAIISQLDMVICVDTAIAHLAGALGKPCWVLLPQRGTDWRWLQERDDSPWYPGVMRLFRQTGQAGWAPVIERLAGALQELAARRPAAPAGEISLEAKSLFQQASAREGDGRFAEAESLLRQALAASPGFARAWQKLAQVLERQGKWQEVESAYRKALDLDPGYAVAWNNFGIFLQQHQRLDEARHAYVQAITHKPDYARANFNLGTLYQQRAQYEDAEIVLGQALRLEPSYARAHFTLGNVLQAVGRESEAEACWQAAVQADPQHWESWRALGQYLRQQGQLKAAEKAFRSALEARPGNGGLWLALGVVLKEQGHWQEAEVAYRRALEINPDDCSARMNLGMLLLTLGRYEEGWPCYESRHDPRRPDAIPVPNMPFPVWKGESLQGKSIVVWPEQGFGDKFHFVRYLPVLKAMGASRVTLVCSPPLEAVFRNLPGLDELMAVEDGQVVPITPHDYWALILSLPTWCGTTLDNIPARLPYIQADPARSESWQRRLPGEGLKVGLVWRGRPTHLNDKQRSLSGLGDLAPLWQVPGVHFISLQKGEGEDEAAHPPSSQALLSFTDELRDFADTAALISQLDLVICVDTAVAHLTGALGIPCWVMLPGVGLDWRWLLDREDSPWYPGVMRLFRQTPDEANWTRVIQWLAEELAAFAAQKTPVGTEGFLAQAMAHWQAGRAEQALRLARQGLAVQPAQAALLNLAGIALTQLGQAREALPYLLDALGQAPASADIHYNLGLAHQALQDLSAAEASYRTALDLQGGHVGARHNLGRVLHALGRPAEAEATYRQAIAQSHDHAEAWHSLGQLLEARQRFAEAEQALEKAVACAPQTPDYRLSLALRRLARGAYLEAWPDYELRYHPERREACPRPALPFPQWQGEVIQGKTLLLWPEQGMGDEIQFVRYLPLLKNRGVHRLTLMCKPALLPLLQGVAGADAVLPLVEGQTLPVHDFWAFPLSLPGLLQTRLQNLPASLPYLQADPARVTRWQTRLPPSGIKVGLVWKGNPAHPHDSFRSLPSLASFAPLSDLPGVQLIGLQKGAGEADTSLPILSLGREMADFADAAALLQQMDLLITVDTAMAHLAAALGKPCWVLLGKQGVDWRWGDQGEQTPWYPGVMRLFRQSPDEDWPAVMARVRRALTPWVRKEPKPLNPPPDYAQAISAYEQKRYQDALKLCREALAHHPDSLDFLNLGAGSAMALGLRAEAEPWLRRAAELYPQVSAVQANLGVLLHEMGQLQAAEPYCRRAVEMDPKDAGVHSNLGSLLQDMGRFAEAEAAYREALQWQPENPMALSNFGSLMRRQQRYDEAEAAYLKARQKAPGSAELAYNLATLRLAQGQFPEGWKLYESRSRKRQANTFAPPVRYPRWQGENLQGKSILVWPEQGFGDELQFVRYLPLLKAKGASRITLGCKGPLRALFYANRQQLGADEVLQESGRGNGLARFTEHDYWVHLLSLPGLLGTRLDKIPAHTPYLQADPERMPAWAARLPGAGFKVGLTWQGNPRHQNDAFRSIGGLSALAPLASVSGVRLVSLQKGHAENDVDLPGLPQPLAPLGREAKDFADLAALISQLDLVICVDTAIAHLAGALGKPVWILLPWTGLDWRWQTHGENSPWYPSARLFRQGPDEPWRTVLEKVALALKETVRAHPGPEGEKAVKIKAKRGKEAAIAAAIREARPHTQALARQAAQPKSEALSPAALAHREARAKSLALYRAGDFLAAVQNQVMLINEPPVSDEDRADDFNLLGGIFHALGDHAASVMAMGECARLRPQNAQAQENLAVALKFAGRIEEAVAQFEKTIALGHTSPNLLDGLASALSNIGRLDEARQRGRESLTLKDREYCAANTYPPLKLPPRKAFDPTQPRRNVIAFSLWGDKPRYIKSALENVRAARYIYPCWQCRFYCDSSVPASVLDALKAEGAQIIMMPDNKLYEGLFWRFQVVNDPEVDFFLVRDADAVVNTKERVAVDEWLASDKHFHVMRDWYTHTELILAGMWGGVAGLLPDLHDMLARYRSGSLETRTLDQQFLRTEIWPLIKAGTLAHDSLFDFMGSRPFPAVGQLPPGFHVGQCLVTG